jgi:cation diffusion facilitator family transporter
MSSTSLKGREKRDAAFKATYASVAVNTLLMAMQIAIGFLAGSDGLLADGVHTLADLAADAMVIVVLRLGGASGRGDLDSHSGGYETLASLFIAALLIATGVETLWRSIGHIADINGVSAVHWAACVVALFVVTAKEALFRYMMVTARRTGSAILVASALHARSDAISALVATLGILGSLAGLPMSDRLAAAVIGFMILRMGYKLARHTLKDSVGRAPRETVRS